ncbi:MAG: thioredoxin [Lachnospiraceae bacterium]|nr:thioredoxin [Lachnospiraceae bacterium]
MEYKFTAADFDQEVLKSDLPVLVDFYADWCGPCKMMGPVVSSMAEKFDGKLKVGKLNIDDNMAIAEKYNVTSIPFFAIIKNGEVAASRVGACGAPDFESWVQSAL